MQSSKLDDGKTLDPGWDLERTAREKDHPSGPTTGVIDHHYRSTIAIGEAIFCAGNEGTGVLREN